MSSADEDKDRARVMLGTIAQVSVRHLLVKLEDIDLVECDACSAKPGSPLLCPACLRNRSSIHLLKARVRVLESYVAKHQIRIGTVRDALAAAAYVCEGVAAAPDRPETVAPKYARSVAKQCRRALDGSS